MNASRSVDPSAEFTTLRIPILRTARLTLRAIRAGDHRGLFALASNPDVARYMHEGPLPPPQDVWNRMATASGQWLLRGYGMWAADDSEGFCGRMGFFHPYNLVDPLLVYALAPRAWGRGYGSEGVSAVLDWFGRTQPSLRLKAHIDPRNTASRRLAAKVGARRDGMTETGAGLPLEIWDFTPST